MTAVKKIKKINKKPPVITQRGTQLLSSNNLPVKITSFYMDAKELLMHALEFTYISGQRPNIDEMRCTPLSLLYSFTSTLVK